MIYFPEKVLWIFVKLKFGRFSNYEKKIIDFKNEIIWFKSAVVQQVDWYKSKKIIEPWRNHTSNRLKKESHRIIHLEINEQEK